ncbi:MAG: DnaD domain protein, partial [Oscillospiraceae bacterium]|nr:DnaD domain protein [Oscillospiraceae bacterium]
EKRYVDAWIEMGFNGDAVEIAYDRTVLKTGKLSWGYIDSIIKSWHEKNLHTPEDILKKDTRSTQNTKPKAREQSQKFNALDMDELERMESYLKKLQETDG